MFSVFKIYPIKRPNEQAAEALREHTGIEYLDCPLVRHKAYPNATSYGKGILEYTPKDNKAIDELKRLIALVYQIDNQKKAHGYR